MIFARPGVLWNQQVRIKIIGWESFDFIDLVIAVALEVYCIFMNIRMHPKAVDKRKTVIEINNLEDMSTFTSKKNITSTLSHFRASEIFSLQKNNSTRKHTMNFTFK